MASRTKAAINNAEEAAVNAPFNSTGLQTAGRLFLLGSRGSMRGNLIRLYGCVRRSSHPTPDLSLDWRAIKMFSSGARPNGVSNILSSLAYHRGAVPQQRKEQRLHRVRIYELI